MQVYKRRVQCPRQRAQQGVGEFRERARRGRLARKEERYHHVSFPRESVKPLNNRLTQVTLGTM